MQGRSVFARGRARRRRWTSGVGADEDEDFNFDTTDDLYAGLLDDVRPAGARRGDFACRGFIEATVQYHDAVSDRKKMKRLVCYPPTTTIGDGRRAFLAGRRPTRTTQS
jgi:hypothetical protein